MSYNKTVWHPRDIITAEKMQKIENQLETLSTGNNASFSPIITNPQDGDTLVYNATQQKWVNGAGGAGGVLRVYLDEETKTLDKTWQEIYDAVVSGTIPYIVKTVTEEGLSYTIIIYCQAVGIVGAGTFEAEFANTVDIFRFTADSATGELSYSLPEETPIDLTDSKT